MKDIRKLKKLGWKAKSLVSLRDYWAMSDEDIIFMANAFGLIDIYDYGVFTHNDFEANLSPKLRLSIIDELAKRDRHISSYITVIISFVALVISIIALLF